MLDDSLTIYASDETVERIRTFVGSEEPEFDFAKIIPYPVASCADNMDILRDWQRHYWGTESNSQNASFMNNYFFFDSESSPALPVIDELARRFPEADFGYQYKEEDYLEICGERIYQFGNLVYEMDGRTRTNWTLEDDPSTYSEEMQREAYIEDNDFPAQAEGTYISLSNGQDFHLRQYIDGKVYFAIDGTYKDSRPHDRNLPYWDDDTDYQFFNEVHDEICA